MQYELILVPLIFIFSFLLARSNFKVAVYLLLVLSVLLHKQLFSIYSWDFLSVRVFMLAIVALGVHDLVTTAYKIFTQNQDLKNSLKTFVRQTKNFLSDPFIMLLTLLWAIKGVSIIFTRNLSASLFLFAFFTTIVFLGIYLYKKFKRDSHQVLSFINFYIFVVFATCLFGFFQLYLFYYHNFLIGAIWPVPGNIPRIGATFWDVNHFAGLLAAIMPVVGVFILVAKNIKLKALYTFMFLIMLGVLLLTNSRTAWILAFIAFIVFICVILYRYFKLKGIALVFLVLALVAIPIAREYSIKSSPFRAKIKSYFHYRMDSFDSHILLIRGAVEIFEQKPILGGGYGSFFEHFRTTKVSSEYFQRDPAALTTRVPAHTIWGEYMAETGSLGLGVYILFLSLVLGTLFYAALTLKNTSQVLLTTAMGASIAGFHIAGIFYSYKSEFFWLIIFLYFLYGVSVLQGDYNVKKIIAYFVRSTSFIATIVFAIAAILIFWGLGTTHLIPWDEAIYAKIAKNMVITGDYIVPHWWPTKIWLEKPPFYMWTMSGFMHLFGFNSLAARLPSAIFGFLTVVVIFFFAKKLYNNTVAFISSFVLVTTFQFLYYARTSMLDITAGFFILLALFAYYLAKEKNKSSYWILAGLAIGFAVMTKGVVGFLPFVIIGLYELYLYFTRHQSFNKNILVNYILVFIFSCLIFLPWHINMYNRFGSQFIDTYIGYHVLDRATSSIEDKGRPFHWYLVVLKVSMRLWFIALLGAFPFVFLKSVKNDTKSVFLVIWALSIFLFFSAATSKLVWYIIPLYPVLAIIVGIFLAKIVDILSYKSLVIKMLLVYILVFVGLVYMLENKTLVYTGDLTGKQVTLIKHKNEIYGDAVRLYADRIELPLLLFYTDGPFEVVDFSPLREVLEKSNREQPVIFITKESRFGAYKETYPDLFLIKQMDEWVLGELPAKTPVVVL